MRWSPAPFLVVAGTLLGVGAAGAAGVRVAAHEAAEQDLERATTLAELAQAEGATSRSGRLAALDLSGRALLLFDGRFARERVGDLPTELVPHFFRSLCDGAGMNLHLQVRGDNDHHQVEACFKAVARALRQAIRREGGGLPSTKGVL